MKRNPPSSTSTTQNNDGLSASMITAQTLTKKERIKVSLNKIKIFFLFIVIKINKRTI